MTAPVDTTLPDVTQLAWTDLDRLPPALAATILTATDGDDPDLAAAFQSSI